jgi:hypothetical protein
VLVAAPPAPPAADDDDACAPPPVAELEELAALEELAVPDAPAAVVSLLPEHPEAARSDPAMRTIEDLCSMAPS